MALYDTDATDFPVCPYCGFVDRDWWDGIPPKDDGDFWYVNCARCEKTYKVTLAASVTFTTEFTTE